MKQLYFSGAIGDTLGLTAILPQLENTINSKIELFTNFPELFFNNPYVASSNLLNNMHTNIQPCLTYDCNIVNHYVTQLQLNYNKQMRPELYLTDTEIGSAKNELKEFNGFKKIAVCLYSSADCKDLRYDHIRDLLLQIKQETNTKLIFFGTKMPDDTHNIFDKFVVGQYGNGLRDVFSLINECCLYIGVDTGLFHAAVALNIPQVVFFKNNGCRNNHYENTYSVSSFIECPHACYQQHVSVCNALQRCMDHFDLLKYHELIIKQLNAN
jgi:ADP-heptose:LPS heptosyltransferase